MESVFNKPLSSDKLVLSFSSPYCSTSTGASCKSMEELRLLLTSAASVELSAPGVAAGRGTVGVPASSTDSLTYTRTHKIINAT